MTRSIIAAIVLVTLVSGSVSAQVVSAPLAASSARVARDMALQLPPPVGFRARPGTKVSTATKISVGFAGAVVGLIAGARIGAAMDGNCACDDPGLKGIVIGAPIGAVLGAIGFVALLR